MQQPNTPVNNDSIQDAINQKKLLDFKEELKKLQDKHGIYQIPVVKHSPFGIVPEFAYMTRDEFEQFTGKKTQPSPGK